MAKEDRGHRMMKNIAMCEDERTKASKAISFLDYDNFCNLLPELECPSLKVLLLSSWSSHLESIPSEHVLSEGLFTEKLERYGICIEDENSKIGGCCAYNSLNWIKYIWEWEWEWEWT
ncbi:hypothetical protein CsatB_015963 [Cannabis sativa]